MSTRFVHVNEKQRMHTPIGAFFSSTRTQRCIAHTEYACAAPPIGYAAARADAESGVRHAA